jgi:hypothetical protein
MRAGARVNDGHAAVDKQADAVLSGSVGAYHGSEIAHLFVIADDRDGDRNPGVVQGVKRWLNQPKVIDQITRYGEHIHIAARYGAHRFLKVGRPDESIDVDVAKICDAESIKARVKVGDEDNFLADAQRGAAKAKCHSAR